MTFRSTPTACTFLGVALVVAGCAPEQVASEKQSKPITVRTVAVAQQDVQRKSTQPATVHAYYSAEIQAKVSGYVKELKVDIGDVVQAGDVLAVIDVPEMQLQLKIAEAKVQLFQAQETQAEAGLELSAAQVKSSQAKLAQAKSEAASVDASVAAAEAEFNRTQDLVDRQSLQNRVLDEVRKKRDSEIARQDAVKSAVTSAEADVTVARAQQSAAEAKLKASKAETVIAQRQLAELQVMVDYATLKAPFPGIVTDRNIDPGDMIRVGHPMDQPLFVVSQVDMLRIHIPVPETDAAHVDRGDAVTLSFPSFPAEQAVTATLTRIAGSLDPSTRTMLVEAEVENSDGKLLPGMFGQASITLSTQVAANMLPARAVRFDEAGGAYVYLVDQDDTIEVVQVTTGVDDGREIEILSGVQRGQKVVDAHLQRFTTGQKVNSLN
ncbi:MAG: efflux RND transporter periplasmic adaptor subunit [Pirellulaceae bacterium]|nr:efflux RND transporter periplasmic adaptor subunit [Pirellulaceae bacterium]